MMIGRLRIRSLIFFLFLVIRSSSQLDPDPILAIPGCPDSCGGVTVPYPFGLTPACSYPNSTDFLLSCNTTSTGDPPRLLWGSLPVLDLNVQQGEMTLSLFISYGCYRRGLGDVQLQNESFNNGYTFIQDSPFTISNKNKFTTIGCDTMGLLTGSWGKNFTTGCASYCQDLSSVDGANSTSCDGVGCCQTAVPRGTRKAKIRVSSSENYANLLSQSPASDLACGYAFLVREDNFTFYPSYLIGDDFLKSRPRTPVLVEWAIGDQNDTCEGMKSPCPAQFSECLSSTAATGYQCKCKEGYQGNPYLLNGCTDIDECEKQDLQPCGFNLTCINTLGSYECRCSDNKTVILDRGKEGYNCPTEKERSIPLYQRLIAACLSAVFLLLGVGRLCYRYKIAYAIKTPNFSRNGGLKLLQRIKSLDKDGSNMRDVVIFNEKKLMKSMNKGNIVFDPKDAHEGKVYKGRLRNETVVVIKEIHLKEKEEKAVEAFVDSVVGLYKTRNHNILQLLGYCFDSKVPLLVYKFNPICWRAAHDFKSLLEIAEKTADWFVNSPTCMAVRLTTIVQETLHFIPAGYFKEMTDTSDVFCFGVVMAALFAGEKPWHQHGVYFLGCFRWSVCKNTVNHEADLTMHCISLLDNALQDQKPRERDNVGSGIVDTNKVHEQILELVKRCFQEDGERPMLTMEQVLGELRNINSGTTTASMEHC